VFFSPIALNFLQEYKKLRFEKKFWQIIFMISADYATYEKYVETCLHVKEDFRKEKTVSAWD
jgi:hypothetical protein